MKKKQKKGNKPTNERDFMIFVGTDKTISLMFINGIPRRVHINDDVYRLILIKE